MITRRTFASRAALFVLGCALQVGGAAALLKRKAMSALEQIEAGMVFNPTWNGKAAMGGREYWQVVSVGEKVKASWVGVEMLCAPTAPAPPLTESHPVLRFLEKQQRDARYERESIPRVWTISERDLKDGNFHFPV